MELVSKSSSHHITSNIFERLPDIFSITKPNDGNKYIQILGREDSKRIKKWVLREYVKEVESLDKWKVIIPKANGSGALGEVLSTPLIGQPLIGHTDSFLSIGAFDTEQEAQACYKYVCSKFARAMLGILKTTQNNARDTWKHVPMQDFTANSDIDWTKSIPEIDKQLYAKYGLDAKEIAFIEAKVKEMN